MFKRTIICMTRIPKRQKKILVSAFIALILLIISTLQGNYVSLPDNKLVSTTPGYYRVLRIEDGDTITVDMNGHDERVRFIGVDTPETQDPRKPVQCFGKAASEFTKQLIGTNSVRLESDPLSSNRDRYNRLLRYIYLPDGRLVQSEILKSGYGFAYVSFPFTRSEEFLNYQRGAREGNQGLWSSCEPTTNKYGGYTSNPE